MVQSIHLNIPNSSLVIFKNEDQSSGNGVIKPVTIQSVEVITDLFWSFSLLEEDYHVEIKLVPKKNCSAKKEYLFQIIKGFYKRNSKLMSIVRYIAEKKIFPEAGAIEKLRPMQKKILMHIRKGMSYTDIAQELNLSPHTVNGHRKNAMKTLGVSNMKEMLSYLDRFSFE